MMTKIRLLISSILTVIFHENAIIMKCHSMVNRNAAFIKDAWNRGKGRGEVSLLGWGHFDFSHNKGGVGKTGLF